NRDDVTPFEQAAFNSPQGVGVDSGGNLVISDTENHAIYLADLEHRQVRLIAGMPGVGGKADGKGRQAQFNRPTAITVQASEMKFFSSGDPRGILVADTGNNRIRFVTFDGNVSTLGPIPKTQGITELSEPEQNSNEFIFDAPQSISTDGVGNIYVVDKSGVKLI